MFAKTLTSRSKQLLPNHHFKMGYVSETTLLPTILWKNDDWYPRNLICQSIKCCHVRKECLDKCKWLLSQSTCVWPPTITPKCDAQQITSARMSFLRQNLYRKNECNFCCKENFQWNGKFHQVKQSFKGKDYTQNGILWDRRRGILLKKKWYHLARTSQSHRFRWQNNHN